MKYLKNLLSSPKNLGYQLFTMLILILIYILLGIYTVFDFLGFYTTILICVFSVLFTKIPALIFRVKKITTGEKEIYNPNETPKYIALFYHIFAFLYIQYILWSDDKCMVFCDLDYFSLEATKNGAFAFFIFIFLVYGIVLPSYSIGENKNDRFEIDGNIITCFDMEGDKLNKTRIKLSEIKSIKKSFGDLDIELKSGKKFTLRTNWMNFSSIDLDVLIKRLSK